MIATGRLVLRGWTDADRPIFHAHCSDPEVMRYLGGVQTRSQTDAALDRQRDHLERDGYCFWAVERADDGALLGFCGLKPGPPDTPLDGAVEIGWRLARAYWGQGYAREAAAASLAWGWANLPAERIGAITVPANAASWGLMERLGMRRAPEDDFDHPAVPIDSPLRRHVTYWAERPI